MMLLLMLSLLGADAAPFTPRVLYVAIGDLFENPKGFVEGDGFYAPVACVRRRGGPIETERCSFPLPKTLMTLDGRTFPVGGRATVLNDFGDRVVTIRGIRVRSPGEVGPVLVSPGVDVAEAVDLSPEPHRIALLERSGAAWHPHGSWRLLDVDRDGTNESWVAVRPYGRPNPPHTDCSLYRGRGGVFERVVYADDYECNALDVLGAVDLDGDGTRELLIHSDGYFAFYDANFRRTVLWRHQILE